MTRKSSEARNDLFNKLSVDQIGTLLNLLRELREFFPLVANMERERLIGPDEVASLLGVSRSMVYKQINKNVIPPPKYIGEAPRWKYGEIVDVYNRLPDVAEHRSSSK